MSTLGERIKYARVQQLTELRSHPAAVVEFRQSHETSYMTEYFRNTSAGGVFILGNEAAVKFFTAMRKYFHTEVAIFIIIEYNEDTINIA